MLFQVGPLTISRRPFNIERWEHEVSGNWAKKDLLGVAATREATGEDDDELTVSGTLHPFNRNAFAGLSSLDLAMALCRRQTPVFVTRGDGKVFGFYGIEKVKEVHDALGPHTAGVGQAIEHEIKLSRVGNLKGPGALVDLGQITIARTATVALGVAVRAQTFTVPGALKDDRILISPLTPVPDGYLVGQATAAAANTITVPVYEPAMVLNASYSFKAHVLALRPA